MRRRIGVQLGDDALLAVCAGWCAEKTAYNTTSTRASVTFGWNTAPGRVTVNAEHRTLCPSGRSFTDSFGPYQSHVYVLGTGGGRGPSVSGVNPGDGA